MPKTGTFNHVGLSVSDYAKGKKFYGLLLGDILGYKKTFEQEYCTGYNLSSGELVCISPGTNAPHSKYNPGLHHLAFNVETHDLIDEAYEKIVKFQEENKDFSASVILDKPALYPQYGPNYYAVFFTDPDGIKLELVYSP